MEATTTTTTTTARTGRENRGNATDRRNRKANIFRHWLATLIDHPDFVEPTLSVPCVWCGLALVDYGETATGDRPVDHVTVDHIICHSAGGSYRMTNLVPSCYPCNNERDDMPFERWAAIKGRDAAALIAHAGAYRRQGRRKA